MTKTQSVIDVALQALDDLKAKDVTVLDVKGLTTITDRMVICSGSSSRHVKALAQNVIEKSKEAGHSPMGVEGLEEAEWVLVDLNEAVIHIMQMQTRAFYQLEKLWDMQAPAPPAHTRI